MSLLHHFVQGVEQVCSTASGTTASSSQWSSLLAEIALRYDVSTGFVTSRPHRRLIRWN